MFSFFRHPKPVGDGKAVATQVVNQSGAPVFDAKTFVVAARQPMAPPVVQAPTAATPRREAFDEEPMGGADEA